MQPNVTPDNYLKPSEGRFARYLIFYRRNRAILFLLLLTLAFVALSVLIHTSDVQAFDTNVTLFIQRFHTPILDTIMTTLTYLGSIGTLIALVAVSALFFLRAKKDKTAGVVVLTLLAYPLNVFIKDFIERNRPFSTIVRVLSPNSGFSFPSGHAMISMTVYGVIAYLFWVYLKSNRVRLAIVIIASLLVFLIGVSRVYLGAHWPTDVTGGWIAGLFLVLFLAEIHKKLTLPAQDPQTISTS